MPAAPIDKSKVLVRAVVVLAGLAVAVLLWAALRPAAFRVERTVVIQAGPARLHPMVSSMREFNTWNPYVRKDPQADVRYRGPSSGIGSAFDYAGNPDIGRGSVEVTDSEPYARVVMQVDTVMPVKGRTTFHFTLTARDAAATEVRWERRGTHDFLARLQAIFVNLDASLGRDFEAGLLNLKTRAEAP